MAVADVSSVIVPAQELQKVASARFRRPNLNLIDDTQERREKYLKVCAPLHKAALKGDWKAAKHILDEEDHWRLARAALTKGWATVLHVAAGANHVHFVEELVKKMDRVLEFKLNLISLTSWKFAEVSSYSFSSMRRKKQRRLAAVKDVEGT